jgi:tetratricopeptide (TPR) repeat protein
MPLEKAIQEFRFAYGAGAEARQMQPPPGALSLEAGSPALMELFRRAFLSTDRPQPREWIASLDALAKTLKRCPTHSGHYYFQELSECPWCEIETRARVRLFNFLLIGSDSQRSHFRLDEIWKEIEGVGVPNALTQPMNLPEVSTPSPEVMDYANELRDRYYIALALSLLSGLTIPMFVDFPLAILALILAGALVIALAKTDQSLTWHMQLLFDRQWGAAGDTVLEKISLFRRDADFEARRLAERWEKEVGAQRFPARLEALRNQRETYENLAQIRQYRISQLESESRKNQLEDFLDQFEIRDAEIKGIASAIKSSLLSHGVETAADVVEEVRQIPTIGQSRAIRLLEWRLELERKFVFDPTIGVSPTARIELEKEMDLLRLRLERELSGGAYYLRQVKKEIDESSQRLQPILDNARQVLAQAEKDWEVASKRKPLALIIFILILAFIIGGAIHSGRGPIPIVNVSGDVEPDYGSVSPRDPAHDPKDMAKQSKTQKAMALYYMGKMFSQVGKFAEAVPNFQQAIKMDPMLNAAHEELGYALYRLKRYEESAEASQAAIRLYAEFGPYYNLGLVHAATGKWNEAALAFRRAVNLVDKSSWKDEYTLAYYYLGQSLLKTGDIEENIESLENEVSRNQASPIRRFELANLYLWVGNSKGANEQYKVLKEIDPNLAAELTELIKKHRVRVGP